MPGEAVDAKQFVQPVPVGAVDAKQFVQPVPVGAVDARQFVQPVPVGAIDAEQFVGSTVGWTNGLFGKTSGPHNYPLLADNPQQNE